MKLFELLGDAREGPASLDQRHARAWLVDERILLGLQEQDSTQTAHNMPSIGAEVHPLAGEEVVIGSAPGCQIQLSARSVSVRHAALERRGGDTWVVRDLSTLGTKVNGVKVPGRVPLPVALGSVLGVGSVELRLIESAELCRLLSPVLGSLPEEAPPLPEGTNLMCRCSAIGGVLLPEGQSVTLGRAKDAGLTLPHPNVSRYHATLTRIGNRVRVCDLGSSNGTWIGRIRVSEAAEWLDPDVSRLTIGPFELSVHAIQGEDEGLGTRTNAETRRIADSTVRGSLEVMPLRQLVQSIELNARSGSISVDEGALVFWEGAPRWAIHARARGEAALLSLLGLDRGEFSFDPVEDEATLPPCPSPEAALRGSFTAALLEYTRIHDES